MSDRIAPPSWTEWTRNPSERSPQRKAFDEILGDLRKDGLIEIRSSLFVHLARYSYLHVKNARIAVDSFLHSVPESVFQSMPPLYRQTEVDAMLKIIVAAGLARVETGSPAAIGSVILTEKMAAGEVARGQETLTVVNHLRELYARWDALDLVSRPASFPTVASVSKATGVDRGYFVPGEGCIAVDDRPETNETNPSPFLQDTIDQATQPIVMLRFWPLPDQKGTPTGAGEAPEFALLAPGDRTLVSLVREQAIPVLAEFFKSNDHHELATEIQAKYSSYMHKYRERFAASVNAFTGDNLEKVLTSTDPEGEAFANAVYVIVQVLRGASKTTATSGRGSTLIVYQAARIAYAHVMALRVRKRRDEKAASSRLQDSALLVAKIRASSRPLSLEELRKTPDASKATELGVKYPSVLELLPLVGKDTARPLVFELDGSFVHRENLMRAFLDLREKESIAQRDRLAHVWAREGIPRVEEIFIPDRDVSPEFLKLFETMNQERVLAANLPDFLKDYIPGERDLLAMARQVWPDGHRGAITPLELVTRGLDPILYEDKDRLRRRSVAGVLNVAKHYPQIVKAAWNIVFMEEGLLSFLLRRIAFFFGSKTSGPRPEKVAPASKASRSAPDAASSTTKASTADTRTQKAADLKRLKAMAPALQNREALVMDREKLASQWNLKLDGDAARKTRQIVDDEIARLAPKVALDQLGEENATKVALFLIEKSRTLAQVTGSRYFHRYLYLTVLLHRSDLLSR